MFPNFASFHPWLHSITLISLVLGQAGPAMTFQPLLQSSGAQPEQDAFSQRLTALATHYFVPPHRNAPKSTTSSATRSSQRCAADEGAIAVVAPPKNDGITLSERPAITLRLSNTSAQQVALIFRDHKSGASHYQAWLPIPQQLSKSNGKVSKVNSVGINSVGETDSQMPWVSFQLPESAPPLLPNRVYQWSLVVVCGDSVQPDDPTFMGWVERQSIQSNQQEALMGLSSTQLARWYGRQGYWYDMAYQLTQAPAHETNFQIDALR